MTRIKNNILFHVTAVSVVVGFLCLNVHDLTHSHHHQAGEHQTNSNPAKKISDDCVQCIISAFSFAEPEGQQYIYIHPVSEQGNHSFLFTPSQQPVSVASPRAPPAS